MTHKNKLILFDITLTFWLIFGIPYVLFGFVLFDIAFVRIAFAVFVVASLYLFWERILNVIKAIVDYNGGSDG